MFPSKLQDQQIDKYNLVDEIYFSVYPRRSEILAFLRKGEKSSQIYYSKTEEPTKIQGDDLEETLKKKSTIEDLISYFNDGVKHSLSSMMIFEANQHITNRDFNFPITLNELNKLEWVEVASIFDQKFSKILYQLIIDTSNRASLSPFASLATYKSLFTTLKDDEQKILI